MREVSAVLAAVVAFCLFATLPAGAQPILDEKNFPHPAWKPGASLPISPNAPVSPTFITAQETAGGNPGGYQSTQIEFTGSDQGTAMVAVGNIRNAPQYNPRKKGSIALISFSYDVGAYFSEANYGSDGSCVGFAFLIKQKGVYYRANKLEYACKVEAWNPSVPGSKQQTVWHSFPKRDLKPTDFVQISPAGKGVPEFTCGRPIQFGYMAVASTNGAQTIKVKKKAGIDNLRIALTPAADPSCSCKLRIKTTTSTPTPAKGQQISLKLEVDNIGKGECETARVIDYWIMSSPVGPSWAQYTAALMSGADKTWASTTSGFPVGDPIPGIPGTSPAVPSGDIYRQPNAPLKPGAPPHVWTGTNITQAGNSAMNCAMTVVSIDEYDALRVELYAAVNNKSLWSASFVTWANNLNAHLQANGTSDISCAGFDVK